MTSTDGSASTPLATLAAWLESSGFVLRRVHAGHYVFRHGQCRALAAFPAEPRPEAVARLMAEVELAVLPLAAEASPATVSASAAPTPELAEAELLAGAAAFAAAAYERALMPLQGGGFLVQVPAFGAVLGQGATIEEAHRSAQDALTAAIAVLLEDGDVIPALAAEPAVRPAG